MDYEGSTISRIHQDWTRRGDPAAALPVPCGSGTPVTVRTLAAPLRYGLIQTEAWVGSTARVTTLSRSARIASISTASRSRAVKAATVASAS